VPVCSDRSYKINASLRIVVRVHPQTPSLWIAGALNGHIINVSKDSVKSNGRMSRFPGS
jgi:hypothetical protein